MVQSESRKGRLRVAREWQLQEAKDKFGQVIAEARRSGPQIITHQGEKTAVVLSFEEYRRLLVSRQKLSDFFRESPLAEVELDLERDKSPLREDFTL